MPHITLIQAAMGKPGEGQVYPKTWKMEPLAIGLLSSLTPSHWTRTFFDDRMESINYEIETDLVCITVECYTARRVYEIAQKFKARGKTVVLGGFHVRLAQKEASAHADAIMLGEAEGVWETMLNDFERGELKPVYECEGIGNFKRGCFADRSIFAKHDYGLLHMVETSRGCLFNCEFCSITRFFKQQYTPREIDDVIAEIKTLPKKHIFFVDDNLAMDTNRLKELCRALIPLKKSWFAQLSIHAASDLELLALMKESGCFGVLIGFESLDGATLEKMGKRVNTQNNIEQAIENLNRFKIAIYATFVFGYDNDTEETFVRTYEFAMKHRFFLAAFNHLVPFPGTAIYERLKSEGRLLSNDWHLSETYRFGDVTFVPKNFTPTELSQKCTEYRKKFYSFKSICRRMCNFRSNTFSVSRAILFWVINRNQYKEIDRRNALLFGRGD